MEEFKVLSDADLSRHRGGCARRRNAQTGRAMLANLGGMGYGDIALVPAPFLKHPRGIRDITEWYESAPRHGRTTSTRSSNGRRKWRCRTWSAALRRSGTPSTRSLFAARISARKPRRFVPWRRSASCGCPTTRPSASGCIKHTDLEVLQALLRFGGALLRLLHRGGLRHREPGAAFGGRHGARAAEGAIREPAGVLGRGRGYAAGAAVWDARRGARGRC